MRQELSSSSDKEREAQGDYIPHPGSPGLHVVDLGFEFSTQRASLFHGCIRPQGHRGWDVDAISSHLAVLLCCKFRPQRGYSAHRDLKELVASRMPRLTNALRKWITMQQGHGPRGAQAACEKRAPTGRRIETCFPWASPFLLSPQCLSIGTPDLRVLGFAGWSIW